MDNHEDTVLWLGSMKSYQAMLQAQQAIASMSFEARAGYSATQDQEQFEGYDYMVQLEGRVAIVSVNGSMTSEYSAWNRYFGLVSYDEVRNAVAAAANHPEVQSILLNVNTPGGDARGPDELSEFLAMVDRDHKPVYAYTGGDMLSAGYWLSVGAREIYATPMASVGSIGVIAIHKEYTAMLEKAGIKATVFREGKFKALGTPYEKRSEDAKEYIQERLRVMNDFFVEAVAEGRGLTEDHVRSRAGEGRVFFGQAAKDVGLVDAVMSLEDVVNQLHRAHNSNQLEVNRTTKGAQAMAKGKRVVITAAAAAAMAAGVPEEEALQLHGAEEGAPAADDKQAPAGEPENAKGTPEAEGDQGAEGAQAAEDKDKGKGAQPDAALTALSSQVKSLTDELIEAKVSLKAMTGERDVLAAAQTGLMKIAASAVSRMQIALGGAAQDLSHLDANALVAQHAAVEKAFTERFPVGGKASVDLSKEEDSAKAPTTVQAAATRVTKIGK